MVEPFEFLLHHPVETGPLLILEGPEFQSFQIQFERGNRRLELVRHAVDEIGLPLIQADFFDNQHQIKRQPRQDCGKDHYAGEQMLHHVICASRTIQRIISEMLSTISTTLSVIGRCSVLRVRRAVTNGERPVSGFADRRKFSVRPRSLCEYTLPACREKLAVETVAPTIHLL